MTGIDLAEFARVSIDKDKGTVLAELIIDQNRKETIGHFPGRPIMPAAALMQAVATLTNLLLPNITQANAVKLVQAARPGDRLTILVSRRSINRLDFTITRSDQLMCKGQLIAEEDNQ